MDGTNMSISGFDQSKKDEAYAALLECNTAQLASSLQIKRYFAKLSIIGNFIFNTILNELFIWRLNMVSYKVKASTNIISNCCDVFTQEIPFVYSGKLVTKS
jgi:hypothetical protein